MSWSLLTRVAGPRRLDEHHAAKVQPQTLDNYRHAAKLLTDWAALHGLDPHGADQWDDLLVEFKADNVDHLTPAKFGQVVASVEFFFPRLRGKLAWTHAVLRGWESAAPRRHTVPLGRSPGKLLACHLASWGHGRLGLGLILQCSTGMRPSEMLGILVEHLSFPHQRGTSIASSPLVIALGTKKGTKSKRAQVVMLYQKDEVLVRMLAGLAAATPPGQPLVPYSLARYRALLKQAEQALGVSVGWGPHSPRAGWATDARAEGISFTEIREGGRWVSDSSLRIYLDVLGANTVLQQLQQRGLSDQLRWVNSNWPIYFHATCRTPTSHYGTQGHQDDQRRVDQSGARQPSRLARALGALWRQLVE